MNPAFGDSNGQGAQTGKTIIPNTIPGVGSVLVGNVTANSVIEPDGRTLDEAYVIGGSESFCVNSNSYASSDMVLVVLNENGTYHTAFGSSGVAAINIGNNGGGVQTSCGTNAPSYDSEYSLVMSTNVGIDQVTAVGSSFQNVNNQGYSTKFAVERFNLSNGSLDTAGFGPLVSSSSTLHTGFAFGPSGTAYAAALDNTSNHVNAIVAGSRM